MQLMEGGGIKGVVKKSYIAELLIQICSPDLIDILKHQIIILAFKWPLLNSHYLFHIV